MVRFTLAHHGLHAKGESTKGKAHAKHSAFQGIVGSRVLLHSNGSSVEEHPVEGWRSWVQLPSFAPRRRQTCVVTSVVTTWRSGRTKTGTRCARLTVRFCTASGNSSTSCLSRSTATTSTGATKERRSNMQCDVCGKGVALGIKVNKLTFCSEDCHNVYRKWRSLEVRIYSLREFHQRHYFRSAV